MSTINFLKISVKKLVVRIHNLIVDCCFLFSLRNVYLNFFGNKIDSSATLHSRIFLFDFGNLTIGTNTTINQGCYLDNRYTLIIGNNVNISHDCKIYTQGHDLTKNGAPLLNGAVVIEDDVWIFPNVLIMPNVIVGEGAVIYPGAVVTKSIPKFSVVGGNPAKIIKMRSSEVKWNINNRIHFSK